MSTGKYDKDHFEKYLKGEMSNEEAHAFEREVLKDPFAQEALEGFEGQNPDEVFSNLDKLKIKTSQKKETTFPLMRIAAAVSLLLISSLAVWFVFNSFESEEPVAMETEVVEEKLDLAEVTEEPTKFAQEDSLIEEIPSESQNETIAQVDQEPEEEVDQPSSTVAEVSEPTAGEASEGLAEVTVAIADEDANAKGAGLTEIENPPVTIQADAEDTEPEVQTSEQFFTLSEKAETAELAKKTDSAIQTDQPTQAPAVSRAARARSLSSDQIQPSRILSVDATPSGGEEEFQKYLTENLVYPQAATDNEIRGTVILELIISSTGEIINIETKRSLGYGCDEEAIRLVREGPKWNPARKNGTNEVDTVRIRVRFKN